LDVKSAEPPGWSRRLFRFPLREDSVLTSGNKKLGSDLIWGFGLPSGRASVCAGMTATCRKHCYAVRTEQYRATAKAHYEKNLKLTKTKGFARRMRAFLIAHHVRVVRIHTVGEFHSARYARKWLRIVRKSPRVRFFAYSRAWRVPAIRVELEALAREPNCRIWFSVDRDTGIPDGVPQAVRLAWLMSGTDDVPAVPVDLIFRVRSLRRRPLGVVGESPVCPAEDGFVRAVPATCDTCRTCWRPSPPIRTAAGASETPASH